MRFDKDYDMDPKFLDFVINAKSTLIHPIGYYIPMSLGLIHNINVVKLSSATERFVKE